VYSTAPQFFHQSVVAVFEEALAVEAEHLRRIVLLVAYLVERRHEDACAGRQHNLMVARRAPPALLVHQLCNQIGAHRGEELLAAIVHKLRARGRVGTHLHELGGRVIAQPLARVRTA